MALHDRISRCDDHDDEHHHDGDEEEYLNAFLVSTFSLHSFAFPALHFLWREKEKGKLKIQIPSVLIFPKNGALHLIIKFSMFHVNQHNVLNMHLNYHKFLKIELSRVLLKNWFIPSISERKYAFEMKCALELSPIWQPSFALSKY